MQPDATLACDPRELGNRIDAPRVHVSSAGNDRHLGAPGGGIFVQRRLQQVYVDGAGSIKRNLAQAPPTKAQDAQRTPDDVVCLRRAVHARLDHPVIAVPRWV